MVDGIGESDSKGGFVDAKTAEQDDFGKGGLVVVYVALFEMVLFGLVYFRLGSAC